MSATASWIARMIVRELQGFERELAMFPDETFIWKTVPGVTNSAGNLALHICGNLQHFVGAVLGRTGYVRNREVEFSTRDTGRDQILKELHKAVAVVERVMPTLTDADLAREFPEAVGGLHMITGMFLTHLAAHAAFHLGQAGYLRRVLTGTNQSAGPVPLTPLAI